jgi:hypothetical protein
MIKPPASPAKPRAGRKRRDVFITTPSEQHTTPRDTGPGTQCAPQRRRKRSHPMRRQPSAEHRPKPRPPTIPHPAGS